MRDYGRISPKFWTGATGKEIRKRGSEAVVVAVYLMTSPHSNMLGLYFQPMMYMAYETGLGIEGAQKGLAGCIEAGFCEYDEASEMVWVPEMAAYQVAPKLKPDDNRCKGIQKDYESLARCPFLVAFFDRYSEAFHLSPRDDHRAPAKPLGEPLRSQEQEQEQEQEKDQKQDRETAPGGALPTGGLSAVSPGMLGEGVGKAGGRTSRPKRADVTLLAYLETCRAEQRKPLPADHPIRDYCRDAGISEEMLQVAWCVFRDEYTSGTNKLKRYKDWPGHFANAVRGCWARLWFTDGTEVKWTSRGLQEKAVLDARHKSKEAVHAPA